MSASVARRGSPQRRLLKRRTNDLRRIDHAGLHQGLVVCRSPLPAECSAASQCAIGRCGRNSARHIVSSHGAAPPAAAAGRRGDYVDNVPNDMRLRSVMTPPSASSTLSAISAHVDSVGTDGGPPPALHPANEILFVSSVTAPFRASARPMMLAPVFSVTLVSAIRFPINEVVVPSVAELPICHATPQGFPPLINVTDDPAAVVSVLPVLKMNVAAALPWALRVSAPVSCADEAKQ